MHSAYNIEVRRVGGAWVSLHPWRAPSLHVNDGGAQAVDVHFGVMSSTQDQLWTHIHLNERRDMNNAQEDVDRTRHERG